jgi:tetratricopeptide (TPR) repeat protein
MLDEQLIARLKARSLLEDDYAVLVSGLREGKIVASGAGAMAIGGDATNAVLTTIVLQINGGDSIKVSEEIIAKLGEAVRRSLPSVLNTLPDVAADFTGRIEEENEIVAALSREGATAAISALRGIGGVGKTALAVKIAHRLTPLFPAAQLLVDLRGTDETPLSPRQAMEDVIRRFHPEAKLPDDEAAMKEVYRDLLRANKALLILDNARNTAQVAPLLPPSPSAAIVTSRQTLYLQGARTCRLDDLPLTEAKALLAKIFAAERTFTDSELTDLAQACLCHPLSLKVAALFLKAQQGQTIAYYVGRVTRDRARLRLEGLPDHDVMAVLGQSLRHLEADDPHLAGHWRDLSVFPADFDPAAAAAVWEIADVDAAIDRLASLATKGFVDAVALDRYRLHDLMRDLARRDWPEERMEAVAFRHARHFQQVLGQANELFLAGGDGPPAGLALFDLERTNIEAGQAWAAARIEVSHEAAALAAQYANFGAHVLSLRLHSREWITWSKAALKGSRAIGDRRGEGAALGNLGLAYFDLGETRTAIEHFKQHLAVARAIGDRRDEGYALGNLGLAYTALGKARKAIHYYKQTLVITRAIGDRRGEGNSVGNLGLAYTALGDTTTAVDYLEQQLVITREISDRRGEGHALGNLGLAYAALGETRKAIVYYEKALVITREISDRRGECATLGNLGIAYGALGETRKAIDSYEQSLAIAREIGDRGSLAIYKPPASRRGSPNRMRRRADP